MERTQMERAGHVGSQECGRQLGVQWGWGLEPQRDGVERTGGGEGGDEGGEMGGEWRETGVERWGWREMEWRGIGWRDGGGEKQSGEDWRYGSIVEHFYGVLGSIPIQT